MRRRRKSSTKKPAIISLLLAAFGWVLWQFTPAQAVFAIANLSDPDKLATLGERGANSRLNKIVYWLEESKERGLAPGTTIQIAQTFNGTGEPRASLVKQSLLQNLNIAEELGLLTQDNKVRLRNGKAGVVTRGEYTNENVEIDHIVPYSLAPEAGNELANLEMLPQTANRQKSNRVGERQIKHAKVLYDAGLITQKSFEAVQEKASLLRR